MCERNAGKSACSPLILGQRWGTAPKTPCCWAAPPSPKLADLVLAKLGDQCLVSFEVVIDLLHILVFFEVVHKLHQGFEDP